ncbi:MAG: hypothetical protein M1448_01075 [Candidatus Marsarchaeota archaeon]|jgi:hypothetical protein|nr:hypothetical protein [Candidatus Marsarchaeota archaeon]
MNMQERVYEFSIKDRERLKAVLSYDPYADSSLDQSKLEEIKKDKHANIIFARHNCALRDGLQLGLDREKCYLHIKANEGFFHDAEEKLRKEFPHMEKAPAEVEEKVKRLLEEEESRSNHGVGLIFGD